MLLRPDQECNRSSDVAEQCHFEAGQNVGWDQRCFAAPAHQQFSMFHDGGPALEASWSHPTM